MDVLLVPTLAAFEEGLRTHRNVQASDQYLDGKLPSIGDLLVLANESLRHLHVSWDRVVEVLDVNYVVSPGSIVPTASPRELLIRLLVNQPSMLEKIATGVDTVLGEF